MSRYLVGMIVLLNFIVHDTTQCCAQGNLDVELTTEGVLKIYGDREDNFLYLAFDDGEAIVIGKGTTVNGSHDWFVVPTESVARVEAILGDGHDSLRFWCQDIVLADISLDFGGGRDFVDLNGDTRAVGSRNPAAMIVGNFSVNTGRDEDFVVFSSLEVVGNTSVSTGLDSDTIWIESQELFEDDSVIGGLPCLFGAGLNINTGAGSDQVILWNYISSGTPSDNPVAAEINGDLEIQFGQGDDSLRWAIFDPGFVTVSGNALIVGGQGVDSAGDLDHILVDGTFDVSGFE